jgi:DNA-binding GntR family transcriptional regulator
MTHGGSGRGAGRKPTPIDEKRLMTLRKEGLSMRAIAERFGVTTMVIRCALDRIKRNDTASF